MYIAKSAISHKLCHNVRLFASQIRARLCGNPLLFFHMPYNTHIRRWRDDNEQQYSFQNTADFKIKSTCTTASSSVPASSFQETAADLEICCSCRKRSTPQKYTYYAAQEKMCRIIKIKQFPNSFHGTALPIIKS